MEGINPEIWRRFQVEDTISFGDLHDVIQDIMGWEDYHHYEFNINADLRQVLKLSHSPDIPSFLLMPSSVRLSYWTEINGHQQPLPRLWQLLPDLQQTAVVKGIEHVENTPDIFSGGSA